MRIRQRSPQPGLMQARQDLVEVQVPAGLQGELNKGGLKRLGTERALVVDFDNIAARQANDAGNARQLSRDIPSFHSQPHQLAIPRETPLNDRGEDKQIDIPTAKHQPHTPPTELSAVFEQSSQATCTCTFNNRFFDLQQQEHGLFQIAFTHQKDVFDQVPNDGACHLPRVTNGDTFGYCVALTADGLSGDDLGHRRKTFGLDTDDFDVRADAFRGDGHTCDESASADGHKKSVQAGLLFQHFESDGPLPCDDIRIVVWMNERQPPSAGKRPGELAGFIKGIPLQYDLSAVSASVFDLHVWRELGHDNHGGDSKTLGVVGDTLGVIARGHSDHS